MRKDYNVKIKRGRDIYSSKARGFSPMSIICGVLAVGLLFAAGWLLYTPVYNLVTGQYKSQSQEQASQQGSEPIQEEQTDNTDKGSAEAEEPVQQAHKSVEVKAAYLPNSIASSLTMFEKELDAFDKTKINSVMIDLKTPEGVVLYNTQNEAAIGAEAVSKTPIDIQKTVEAIKKKGFTPVARISAFRDAYAKLVDYDMVVKYNNTDITWLDKAPEYGGVSWINPYSKSGKEYICQIISEAAKSGFEVIVLDAVQFPNGYSMETATYPESSGKTKQQALAEFVEMANKAAEQSGAQVYIYVEAPKVLGMDTQIYGGNPLNFVGENIALGVMPSLLGERFQSETLNINSPSATPYETVLKLLEASKLEGKNVIAFIQAYTTSTPITSENYKDYTQAEVDEQVRAAEEFGTKGYIQYNPDGKYK